MLVSVFGNTCQANKSQELQALLHTLLQSGLSVEIEASFYKWLQERGITAIQSCSCVKCPSPLSQIIISAGGDGTLLQACRWAAISGIPVAGINTGHLGFLTAWHSTDTQALAQAIHTGNISIESRTLLEVSYQGMSADVWPYALNDVSLLKENTGSMIRVRTSIDNNYLTDYEADGLVISTPAGSTAYNLSAGGPILQPTVPAIVLTPVAPHTLTMRPLVVSDGSHITACTYSRTGSYLLTIDGVATSLPSGVQVQVSRAPFELRLVGRPGYSFADALRDKLLWGTSLTTESSSSDSDL